ncbi:hypothetical protein B0O80DRAFT_435004 [Mortierella sp. GBAus27b]|nr:hypothetical protein BGX31_001250 [Mortierella sp. GBA43]KAI8362070.1 hypothetical protein B0O80DRAFT_435004 [Mortierella sp. GBAus27b]
MEQAVETATGTATEHVANSPYSPIDLGLQALSLEPPAAGDAHASSDPDLVQQQQQQHQQHASRQDKVDPDTLPVNWPKDVRYMLDYEYHPSTDPSILDLVQGRRRRAKERGSVARFHRDPKDKCEKDQDQNQDEEEEAEEEEEEKGSRTQDEIDYDAIPIGHAIPGSLRVPESPIPDPPFEVRLITWPPTHPVLGSYGLFATKALRPGTHLLDYISVVVPDQYANPDSDHTLYLCHDLNLDASAQGNHGRFVNDFRGIRTHEQGPNVSWDLYRDQDTGQVRMGCKVLKRIRKDDEILCTYGHTYWKSRGVRVTGSEWEDWWDTDLEDWSDQDENEGAMQIESGTGREGRGEEEESSMSESVRALGQ